jgi:hypothetical protein
LDKLEKERRDQWNDVVEQVCIHGEEHFPLFGIYKDGRRGERRKAKENERRLASYFQRRNGGL